LRRHGELCALCGKGIRSAISAIDLPRWFSTDLKADLVNISESPDSGKHVRKLVNIRAGEPDPLLFQVPPDFTVKETQQQ
jgi:hypothetical protein